MDEKTLVFVYGSLKRGYWNNHYLKGATFVGEAHTAKLYTLLDGGVPFAIPDEQGLPIKGEVYEIDISTHLGPLDRLEGHPHGYTRTTIGVTVSGEVFNAFIYEYRHSDPLRGRKCETEGNLYSWKG